MQASSHAWGEHSERKALAAFRVAYGGAIITVPKGARFYVDSLGRVLVGWHGSYDPPGAMLVG